MNNPQLLQHFLIKQTHHKKTKTKEKKNKVKKSFLSFLSPLIKRAERNMTPTATEQPNKATLSKPTQSLKLKE